MVQLSHKLSLFSDFDITAVEASFVHHPINVDLAILVIRQGRLIGCMHHIPTVDHALLIKVVCSGGRKVEEIKRIIVGFGECIPRGVVLLDWDEQLSRRRRRGRISQIECFSAVRKCKRGVDG